MMPGKPDESLMRRHLFGLDAALTRLERRVNLALAEYMADPELQWAVERGLLVCAQNVLDIPPISLRAEDSTASTTP